MWLVRLTPFASGSASAVLTALAISVSGYSLRAEEGGGVAVTGGEKWGYNLFRPVPPHLMRDMSTDRPDQTESPYTVDAGHVQVEMDVASATFDHERSAGSDVRTEVWGVGPLNLKVGVLNNIDIQVVLEPYVQSRVEDRSTHTIDQTAGFGDLHTRLKINCWGNDGGRTALAVMPFVKWPLKRSALRNGKTEGGILIPFGTDLGQNWGLGLMTGAGFVSDGSEGYTTEYVNSVTLGRDLTDKIGVYVEFFTVVGPDKVSDWQGQVDVGWTFRVANNTQFDVGCNFGVTEAAPDFNPFLGFSFRF